MLSFQSHRRPGDRQAPERVPVLPPTIPGPASPPDDGVEPGALWHAIWRHRRLVGLAPLVMGALVWLVANSLPERFTARATVMLDPREQRVIDNQDQVVADLKLSSPILDSEVAVLRSPAIRRAAIAALGADRFAAVWPELAAQAQTDPAPLVAALAGPVAVSRLGSSYVIEIATTTRDPDLSADLANALADAYIRAQLEDRRRVAERATRWLTDQVTARRQELARAEAEIAMHRSAQLVAGEGSTTLIEQQLAELSQQQALARSDHATQAARLNQIETMITTGGVVAAADTLATPLLTDLRRDRGALLREEARLAASLGPGHADRRALSTQLARLEQALAEEVANIAKTHRNEMAVLALREAALAQEVTALETRLAGIASSSLRLTQLEREAEAARTGFEVLLGRLGETRAQVELQRAEAKLIAAAVPPMVPSAPRPGLWGLFGASLGLSLGLGAALMLELAGRGFRGAAQLQSATGLPVLASLPQASMRRPRAVLRLLHDHPYALLAERVRQLRTTLGLMAGRQAQSVLLLSSLPGEGKTTTALALAHLYARSGARVILLDLDTRRAALAQELDLSGAGDLSDVIGGEAPLESVIHHPEGLAFDVLATGRTYALLADGVPAARMRALIEALKRRYDVVLMDAPPVLAVPDGLTIAAAADRLLYLVRWKDSPRRSVAQGLGALRNVGLRPDGLILTQVDPEADGGGYEGYG